MLFIEIVLKSQSLEIVISQVLSKKQMKYGFFDSTKHPIQSARLCTKFN